MVQCTCCTYGTGVNVVLCACRTYCVAGMRYYVCALCSHGIMTYVFIMLYTRCRYMYCVVVYTGWSMYCVVLYHGCRCMCSMSGVGSCIAWCCMSCVVVCV